MNNNYDDLKGMSILMVDDVPENIDVLRKMLGENGFIISVATSGEIALNLVNLNKPDLILLDIMMPGIDGFETCKRLKADNKTANIPIVFITARTEIEAVVKGFKLGGVDYITKPFNQEEVLIRVKTQLKIQKLLQEQQRLNKKLQTQNDELIESKNQYNIIVEEVTDGVFCLDTEGKIVRSNYKFFSALGYSEKEILGKPIEELINTESPSEVIPQLATKRFNKRATSNLKIQFCVNEKSPLWKERKYFTMRVDSFGIWNLPNTIVMEKGMNKTFLGTICIVKQSPR